MKARHITHSEEKAEKIIDDAIKDIAGPRYGAKHVLRHLANPDREDCIMVAGFIASPEGAPICTLDAFSGVKRPLSIAWAEDPESKTNAIEREKIRAAMDTWTGPYQINLYSHIRDGFAIRRDVTRKMEIFAKRQAFVQAL
ncbi:hypothetical protein ONS95_005537 [Cadophora gregata]|uniref:uncharacterized protein n=1 Tax=Cadophora gregata TaxID=51156 RepID=UPI0026DD8565|nr:uncharacterized protein ONS95_005537 [Cadophora gregata]KAK0103516.1 hypothetical protein ONS95_005537 [Cadophora gregata]KAK0107709.1 hypothetical protein ONS96_003509 [Cadophora gregata f. sp. sojae]